MDAPKINTHTHTNTHAHTKTHTKTHYNMNTITTARMYCVNVAVSEARLQTNADIMISISFVRAEQADRIEKTSGDGGSLHRSLAHRM